LASDEKVVIPMPKPLFIYPAEKIFRTIHAGNREICGGGILIHAESNEPMGNRNRI